MIVRAFAARFFLLGFVILLPLLNHSYAMAKKSKKESDSEDAVKKKSSFQVSLKVHKKILGNGLKILVVENHKLPILSYYSYFQVGSKYEGSGTTGSSHLLEHMMFKGAKKYGAGEFDKLVEGNGGINNAYTTNDMTVYYESLPSEHLEVVADVESDRMQNLLLAKESFEKERNVVLEERKMRYENSDRGKLYLTMMKNAFAGTPYGSSVIGTVNDLKTITREKVQEYFKTYYAPNNALIVVVGDVEAKKVFKTIEEKYGHIKPTKDLERIKKTHLAKLGFKFPSDFAKTVNIKGTSPTPMFSLAFKGVKLGGREAFILDILSSIIGEGASSYLSQKLVTNKKPLLQNIHAANYTIQESGIFFIGGQLLEKVRLKKVLKKLRKSITKSCDEAITERAMQKVINQYLVGMLGGLDKNAGVARFLADREVYYNDYEFYKKEFGIYESITKDELQSVCRKYLKVDGALTISIWNKN